jgi:hypothetical protein
MFVNFYQTTRRHISDNSILLVSGSLAHSSFKSGDNVMGVKRYESVDIRVDTFRRSLSNLTVLSLV